MAGNPELPNFEHNVKSIRKEYEAYVLSIGEYDERVFLGGLTCDSDDYYNSEQHTNAIYLPVFNETKPLFSCFVLNVEEEPNSS